LEGFFQSEKAVGGVVQLLNDQRQIGGGQSQEKPLQSEVSLSDDLETVDPLLRSFPLSKLTGTREKRYQE
jgi:hypothetical protein